MMHGQSSLTFWQHHSLATIGAIFVVSISRLTGRMADIGRQSDIVLHTALIVTISSVLFTVSAFLMMRYGPERLSLRMRAILGCAASAPLLAVTNPLISWVVGIGPEWMIEATTREDLIASLKVRMPLAFSGYLLLGTTIWMVFNFGWWQRFWAARAAAGTGFHVPETAAAMPAADPPAEPGASPRPLFLDKLPVHKQGDVWALSSELHYVRVYTSRGHDLVLMRLSDAIRQCDGIEGVQVHRSHWVAQDGVDAVETIDGRMQVRLRNDVTLPVSRSYSGAVRNALAARLA
ncbi:MAG: LytTR family transcriptional regulator [Hyphomonas sp.]|nr:LytTR family transcriptional regulator [Hyphomonas sp.]